MSSAKEPMSNMVMVVKWPQLIHQMMHHLLYHLVSVTNAKYGHGGQMATTYPPDDAPPPLPPSECYYCDIFFTVKPYYSTFQGTGQSYTLHGGFHCCQHMNNCENASWDQNLYALLAELC